MDSAPGDRLAAEIVRRHDEACARGEEMYEDPASGLWVMTAVGLRKRGYCCGSGCRHCPYRRETSSQVRQDWS